MKLKNDNQLKILSIIVAIVLWTFVTNTTNPSVNKVFRNIPIVIKNQDSLERSGFTIIGLDDINSATVRLTGSRDRIVALDQNDIYASIDISDVREGIQSVIVNVDTPTGVNVESVDPAEINLNIQRRIEKTLPVNLIISDEIKDGRIVEVNEQTPKMITVKGPASQINKVDRIEAKIEDNEFLDGKIHNVPIAVLDKKGEVLDSISASSDDINISFFTSETKKVGIEVKTSGTIASGYEKKSITSSPETIIVKGPEQILRDIENISTKPINIDNIRSTISGESKLDLPEGVKLYDGENMVKYKIEVEKKSKTNSNSKDSNENQ